MSTGMNLRLKARATKFDVEGRTIRVIDDSGIEDAVILPDGWSL